MTVSKVLSSKWTKAAIFVVCLAPFLRLAAPVAAALNLLPEAVANALPKISFFVNLGPNPIEFITHYTGDWTLRFLLFTLTITPLRWLTNWPQVVRHRRMLGLFTFFYGVCHFLVWAWLDKDFVAKDMWADILKRWYITVGMAALLAMLPLAITSTAGWVRRMGYKNWQRLHRLIYFAGVAVVTHYYLEVKSDIRLPLMYAAILAVLLGYRVVKHFRTPKRPSRKPSPVAVRT